MKSKLVAATQWLLFPAFLAGGPTLLWLAIENDLPAAVVATALAMAATVGAAVAERLLPRNPAWRTASNDVSTDAMSFFMIVAVLEPLVKTLAPIAVATVLLIAAQPQGWTLFPTHWAWPAQLLLFALLAELGRYWIHRLSHTRQLLWRVHAAHHSVERLYFFNTFRLHPLNHLWNYFASVFPVLLLGPGEDILLLYFVLSATVAAFQHANIDLRHGPLNYLVATNTLHFWHHSRLAEEGNRNYGSVLIVWDLVFGSYFNRPGELPAAVGLGNPQHYPLNGYWQQLVAPFCWNRCVREQPGPAASGELVEPG